MPRDAQGRSDEPRQRDLAGRHGVPGVPAPRVPAPRVLSTVVAFALALTLVAFTGQAGAAFGIASFDGGVVNADGTPAVQAGAHPFAATTSIAFNTVTGLIGPKPDRSVKDLHVDLPVGFVGNPNGLPKCAEDELLGTGGDPRCPYDTQVGVLELRLGGLYPALVPVFNVEPALGVAATFGFNAYGVVVHMNARVRSESDNGVTVDINNIDQTLPITSTTLTLWGVPADSAHDVQRCYNMEDVAGTPTCTSYLGTDPNSGDNYSAPHPSHVRPQAFLSGPASCSGAPLVTTLRADSWSDPDDVKTVSFVTHDSGTPPIPYALSGCDRLDFRPSIAVAPGTTAAGSPAALKVELGFDQTGLSSPAGLAPAPLEAAKVTLPKGVAINPSSADGLTACTDEQTAIGSRGPVTCPAASRIGTAEAVTPLLNEPLTGSVYLRTQASRDPASGEMFRILLNLVNEDRGLNIKLAGRVAADPVTGRLTTTFTDNPQVPVSRIALTFKAGPRAPLAMPPGCGSFSARAELTPWSSPFTPAVSLDAPLSIDQACDRAAKFEPSVSAGVVDPHAGASSAFVMDLSRPDGQQELGSINGSLPAGLLATLKSVPLCSAARGAAGSCGQESRIGKVQVAVGAGGSPLWLPQAGRPEQPVFLTEPYRPGDVAGMSIVVPAVAGPFDLGTVVNRVFLKLRPKDQGVDLQSDPLPRIVGGVPVQIRRLVVTVDRPGFMVNPTSCREMSIDLNAFSQTWAKAPLRSRFAVGGCARLPLSPVIGVSGGGKGNTARFTHPSLKVTVRQVAGQAHLDAVNVVLPKAFNVDLQAPALKAACPREVYAQDKCSAKATVGTVRAVTPLLAEPLTGPAFLLQKKGELPDIVMRLHNSQMSLDLIGVLDFLEDSRIITRVKGIPDAALSSFELNIRGGKGGSLLNRADLCAKRAATQATFRGQNGKVVVKTPTTAVSGCAKAAAKAPRSGNAARPRSGGRVTAFGVVGAHHRAAGGRS